MRYKLYCRDLELGDDFVSSGKTRADVIAKMVRHIMKEHDVSVENLNVDKMKRLMKRRGFRNVKIDPS